MHLSKIHVGGAMYKVFCQKFQISIRTTQDFSTVIIVINSKVSVHRTGAASPWLTENTTVCVVKSYT